MNNINVFKNEEFGEVNVIVKNNKEYIEAIAVAKTLGYSNPRDAVIRHCESKGVIFSDVGVVTGTKADGSEAIQYVEKKFIDEGNVYRLIIRSKLPSARRFEEWLMDEVIPSIRRNGMYMNDNLLEKALNEPEFIIRMAEKLKEEKEKRLLQRRRVDALESIITIDKPYSDFGKKVEASQDSITIGQYARILSNNKVKIGRNRLFSWFRENGYFIKHGKDKNMPKQSYIDRGLFSICEKVVNTVEGEIISTTTLITGKGQLYFIDKDFSEPVVSSLWYE